MVEDTVGELCKSLYAQVSRRLNPSPRVVHRKLVVVRLWDLNPSRTKRLYVGLDIERAFQVCVFFENSSGKAGVCLSADEFRELVSDSQWLKTASRHMLQPFAPPCPSRVLSHVDFRLTLVNEGDPGLRIQSHDGNFSVIGAVTWSFLLRQAPRILDYISGLEKSILAQNYVRAWLVFLYKMADISSREFMKTFANDNDAKCFLLKHAENCVSSLSLSEDLSEFLLDFVFKYSDCASRSLADSVNEKVFENAPAELLL